MDDGAVREKESGIAPVFEKLPFEESEELFDRISQLVTAYQRAAFLEGMQVGAQLYKQLLET